MNFPLNRAINKAVREEIQAELSTLNLVKGTVIFAISCVVDTGRVTKDKKKVGCNRISVMSNRLPHEVQYVYKLRVADIPNLLIEADNWNFSGGWVVSDGWNEFANREIINRRLGTEGRLTKCTYSVKDLEVGGQSVTIGFGTCLDSMKESYPGTNIIAFCSGGTNEAKIQDAFHQVPLDTSSPLIGHDGYLINDTDGWSDMSSVAGFRKWSTTDVSNPKARTADAIPSYTETIVNNPRNNKPLKRTLVVTQLCVRQSLIPLFTP
ncbi:hypothetical protein E1B28_003327 [Marasmius oreades]|uniref:Uncharacterized protein n=1 Tax=Marasmius oreades TaxID=181124 RepID=A0A9P7UMA4_9AGAR|nr:uncharacterized protein E1B28_003327 [Marasmius oreades]KAG7085786.1 hypothetical protein E1B28_003327 [Marasmius oreades]